jgi:hypothetical protein
MERIIKGMMRAHVENGAGARNAKKFLAEKMNEKITLYDYNRYKEIAMRRTFRNMQDFVYRFCNKKLEPLKSS